MISSREEGRVIDTASRISEVPDKAVEAAQQYYERTLKPESRLQERRRKP